VQQGNIPKRLLAVDDFDLLRASIVSILNELLVGES
jgi:hypothetical protein